MGWFAFLVVGVIAGVNGASLQFRPPYRISLGGGSTITIDGWGFSADQFNHFNSTLGNRVFLENRDEVIECPVISYLTNTRRIVCSAGRPKISSSSNEYKIRVFVDGTEASGALRALYVRASTPYVSRVTPRWGFPGQKVLVSGDFKNGNLADPVGMETSGISRVFIGGQECQLYNSTGDPLGNVKDSQLTCLTGDAVGPMNASVYVSGLGASDSFARDFYVDAKDVLYQYEVAPVIYNVTPATGSSAGGTHVTVHGKGFLPQKNVTQVLIGGSECRIANIATNLLTCVVPPSSITSPASGERGLLLEMWKNQFLQRTYDLQQVRSFTPEMEGYSASVIRDLDIKIEEKANFVAKLSGYFHPPHDGLFVISLISSHRKSNWFLHIAKDGNPAKMITPARWTAVELRKDTPAYMEMVLSAEGSGQVQMALTDYNSRFNKWQTSMATNDRQTITLDPQVKYEVQRVTLKGHPSQAQLFFHGGTSQSVDLYDDEEIRSAVVSLVSRKCHMRHEGENPDFYVTSGFEEGDPMPVGMRAKVVSMLEPFCGRFSAQLTGKHLLATRKRSWINLLNTPYICYALRGNTNKSFNIKVNFQDFNDISRNMGLTLYHQMQFTDDKWSYNCWNLHEMAMGTRMKRFIKKDSWLKLIEVEAPEARSATDILYVDQVVLSSKPVHVEPERPSVLQRLGIVVSDVQVIREEADNQAFSVTLKSSNCAGNFPLLGFVSDGLNATWMDTLSNTNSASFNVEGGEVEVERLQSADQEIQGTWGLTIRNNTIKGVPPTVSASELEDMITGSIGVYGIQVKEGGELKICGRRTWDLEWVGLPGKQTLVAVDASNLTLSGEPVLMTVEKVEHGMVRHRPTSSQFFSVRRNQPHVAVTVRGYRAVCQENCSFTYSDASTPKLFSLDTAGGSGEGTDVLIIHGEGFTVPQTGKYSVTVGDHLCEVTSVLPDKVSCKLDSLSAGTYPISLAMQPVGTALHPVTALVYEVPLSLTSIAPTDGGMGGGYEMVLRGKGLPKDVAGWLGNSVRLGDMTCRVVDASSTSVTCVAPSGQEDRSVDVRVEVNGVSASVENAFTYLPHISPSIQAVDSAISSVLGGGTLTIMGADFGSGEDGMVKVGGVECPVAEWHENTITCVLPTRPPGEHTVTVRSGNRGFASGSASIPYILKVVGTSALHGSVNGGTTIALSGQGFGDNCSRLKVTLGEDMACDLVNCSDNMITCVTRRKHLNHQISNNGSRFGHAHAFAWTPSHLDIGVGDSVTWSWSKTYPFSKFLYNVFQTRSPAEKHYNGIGFHSGTAKEQGSFTVTFHEAGTYHYASDALSNGVFLSGVVEVSNPKEKMYKVKVTLDDIEAEYNASGEDIDLGICSGSQVPTGCSPPTMTSEDEDGYHFTTHICLTPVVTSVSVGGEFGISGRQITSRSTIIIKGSGLGSSPCQTKVTIGRGSCEVTSTTEDSVTCVMQDVAEMMSLVPTPVKVVVDGRGTATLETGGGGLLTLMPTIHSISPLEGSMAGGTLITITGSGLRALDSVVSVSLERAVCHVVNVTSTKVMCITRPVAAPVTANLTLYVSSAMIPAINEASSTTFSFTEAATPSLRSTDVSTGKLVISGTSFGSDPSKVNVTLKRISPRQKRSLEEGSLAKEKVEYEEINFLGKEFDSPGAFWGSLSGTKASSFADSRALGAWKVAGSKRATQGEERAPRTKRQTDGTNLDTLYHSCEIVLLSDTSIVCDTSHVTAGSYEVAIAVEGIGNTLGDEEAALVTFVPLINNVMPVEGSVQGDTLLTISGTGFIPGDVTVEIDGIACQLESVSTNSLTCRTPSHASGVEAIVVTSGDYDTRAESRYAYSVGKTPVLNAVRLENRTLYLEGQKLSISGNAPEILVGGAPCPVISYADNYVTCHSPSLAGGAHTVIARDLVYGNSNSDLKVTYDFNVERISPDQGGLGGTEVTVLGTGFDPDGNTDVTICGDKCDVITSTTNEIKCVTSPRDRDTEECDVVLRNVARDGVPTEVRVPKVFSFRTFLTPYVKSISPRRGGTAGGTRVIIKGSGFSDSGNSVSIGGSPCIVAEESTTSITCVTEALPGGGTFPVTVQVPGIGLSKADEECTYSYVDLWSSRFTWGNEDIPSEGQLVVVDKGHTVYLDQSTEVLKMLLIKGGHLIVDPEATVEVILRAHYILIVDGGSLSIGSEAEPFRGKATIELYGNVRSIQLPIFGAKVLAVRNGTLDLHGAPVPVPWTRLASHAAAGDTTLNLEKPVTWQPGDVIVIASTERRFHRGENEELTIATVSEDGLSVTVTEPLRYHHAAKKQSLGGRTVETRAEVGLLTRNVKIRGVLGADFVDDVIEGCGERWHPGQFKTSPCFSGKFGPEHGTVQFGATIMLAGKIPHAELAVGRLQYVEISEAGQAYQIGRYPLHFHMLGRVRQSYVRGCSVHHTYNRAITVHATNGLTLDSNVVYNTLGHAFFTEDGVEEENVFQYNLAVFTRMSSSLLNADLTPAAFWIVHPNNLVRHNAAAGGTHFGFWYRLESTPSGPSAGSTHCPNKAPLGGFYNNSAHSMGMYGLWVYSHPGYFPKTRKCGYVDTVARFEDFTAWRCERGAEVGKGGALQFHNFVLLDNEKAGAEMVQVTGGYGQDDGAGVFNSLLVGYSALTPEHQRHPTSGIVAPEEHMFTVEGNTFVNYEGNECVALSGCSQCTDFRAGSSVRVGNLSFINSPNKIRFKWEHETIWQDIDGSLSGSAGNVVVADMGILPPQKCQRDPSFSVNPVIPGVVCSNSLKFLQVKIEGQTVSPPSIRARDLVIANSHGVTRVPFADTRLSLPSWTATVFAGETFSWDFDYSGQITDMTYLAVTSHLAPEDYFFVEHKFQQNMTLFRTISGVENNKNKMPEPLSAHHGDYYWNPDSHRMTYIVKGGLAEDKGNEHHLQDGGISRVINFKAQSCQYENCLEPVPPKVPNQPESRRLWSDTETWREVPVGSGGHPSSESYHLPKEGDDIIIPEGLTIVVDTSTPPLGRVFVYGNLEFQDTMDHLFQAQAIVIQGGALIAGHSESQPFMHKLRLVLRTSVSESTSPEGVARKSIAVYGKLALHGQPPNITWDKLGATASPGDTQLTLLHDVDPSWKGTQVMVTSTSEEATHTEIRTVTHVSGKVLTLDSPLAHQHLGEQYTLADNSSQYGLRGEVGVLTRSIVVEGEVDTREEDFGGSIRVTEVSIDGVEYRGTAQLYGVELRNMGQEGFTSPSDPRFSLVFQGLGPRGKSSYVRKCSFNKNYNTAIGIFTSAGVAVENSVIYHTVGSSIKDEGSWNVFKHNLVSVMLFPGTYKGRMENLNEDWHAGFDLREASNAFLLGNVVSGSEQIGFRVYGEHCNVESTWTENEAHNVIFGVMLWKNVEEGPPMECRRVRGFYVWRASDTAFYMQHYASLLLQEVVSVDNQVGVNQLVYGPPALSHQYYSKTATTRDSTFISASPAHTCQYQTSRSAAHKFFEGVLWSHGVSGGHAGIVFASFVSRATIATKGFHIADNYPALHGATRIANVTFANFATRTCGRDVALLTNSDSNDAIHPVFTRELTFVGTPKENYLFFHEPNLYLVRPADCVDMDCDGLKKVVVQDMDGSLLGTANATATSQAEFEWDGEPARGIGDYRIPISLRQREDGSKIMAQEKFPNKGIVRDGSCSLEPTWRAWKCSDLQHRMMVIESLDTDSLVRRLSPVALIANPGPDGYVDLVNGPMDRGWCLGYSCQHRISTFYSIVAPGQVYEMAMSSNPPQELRLHLLHSDPSEVLLLRLFFPVTQRFDVYLDGSFVPPKNVDFNSYPESYQLIPDDPEDPEAFYPTIEDAAGTNYLARESKFLHLVLRGGHTYEIRTTPVIVLSMGILVNVEDFYEVDVVRNVMLLLNVAPENVRVTSIVREDSGTSEIRRRRKRRSTGSVVQIEMEVSGAPLKSIRLGENAEGVSGEHSLTYQDLLERLGVVVNCFQTLACNMNIVSLKVKYPLAPPEDPVISPPQFAALVAPGTPLYSVRQQEVAREMLEQLLEGEEFLQPAYMKVLQLEICYSPFSLSPMVAMFTEDGTRVSNLGTKGSPWLVTATLEGGSPGAKLEGKTTVPYMNGKAAFDNLTINAAGEGYRLRFTVTQPENASHLMARLENTFSVEELE